MTTNKLANALVDTARITHTENGMVARNTTGEKCLDLFSVIGALRQQKTDWFGMHTTTDLQTDRAERLFADAYNEDPLIATKILFYARDIREGLGERDLVKYLYRYAAKYHTEAMRDNLDLVGFYGRYDDLYAFIGTPLEEDMWKTMKVQFEADVQKMKAEEKDVSLLAKWIKTPDASSKKTRQMGITTALKLGYSVRDFKRLLKALRKHIGIVEQQMSANEWNAIHYPAVPSRAMMVHRNAFSRHDAERFDEFINKAVKGEVKINSKDLYPYDIVEKVLHGKADDTLEAQWRQLPDYVDGDDNIIVMADVSGSMTGRPMASSIGLGLYFAERNKGAFHNLFLTFSREPQIVEVKGETLEQKVLDMESADWGGNTNIEAAFRLILEKGIANHVPQSDMPKAMIIVTDMEFDSASRTSWNFFDMLEEEYKNAGYEIPNIVFWNVNSRHDTFHADSERRGVVMVSGQATSTFKTLLKCMNCTPVELMLETINSERYAAVTIADK